MNVIKKEFLEEKLYENVLIYLIWGHNDSFGSESNKISLED